MIGKELQRNSYEFCIQKLYLTKDLVNVWAVRKYTHISSQKCCHSSLDSKLKQITASQQQITSPQQLSKLEFELLCSEMRKLQDSESKCSKSFYMFKRRHIFHIHSYNFFSGLSINTEHHDNAWGGDKSYEISLF